MSSASVFNPHVLAELRHIRPSSLSPDRMHKKFTPSFAEISAVRRNIFGPVDHEECRIFMETNLQQQEVKDMEYWGFDFVNELPLPGTSRFVWEAVPDKPVSRPQKRIWEPEYDISHLYAEPLEDLRPCKDEGHPTEPKVQQIDKVKQSLITDFLKSKKNNSASRLKQLKKMSVTPSPNRTGRITRNRRSIRS